MLVSIYVVIGSPITRFSRD